MRRYEYQLAYEGWLEDFFEWVIVAQPSGASVSAVSAGGAIYSVTQPIRRCAPPAGASRRC